MTRIVKSTVAVSDKTIGSEKELVLVVERHENQAAIQPAKKRLAFLWAHAAGFTKGTLYSLMRLVQAQLREQYPDYDLDHVLFDARNHGESARLNEGKYHPFCNYMARSCFGHDIRSNSIKNMITLSVYLAELYHPSLFDAMCLMDPVIRPSAEAYVERLKGPLLMKTLKKRDTWENRAAFEAYIRKSAYFRGMHPEAMEEFVKHGVSETPNGKVTLTCSVEQEYASAIGAYNALRAATIPIHITLFENSNMVDVRNLAGPMSKMSGMVTVKVFKGEQHLCPLQKPELLVHEIVNLVSDRLGSSKGMVHLSKL